MLERHSPIYCIKAMWENVLNPKHTLDRIYLTSISQVKCFQISLHSDGKEMRNSPKQVPSHCGILHRLLKMTWWRHQMETFSALLALCAGNSPVPGELPSQRPVTRRFDVVFDIRLNKWLSKQSWGWWFETPSRSLWCHCNGVTISEML